MEGLIVGECRGDGLCTRVRGVDGLIAGESGPASDEHEVEALIAGETEFVGSGGAVAALLNELSFDGVLSMD